MNRRSFLGLLGATVAALAVKPFKALVGADAWTQTQRIETVAVGDEVGPGFFPQVSSANQEGSILATDGWEPLEVLRAGDLFQIVGRYAINPITRKPTTVLQTFVVTADVVANSGGAIGIPLHPPITPRGPYQNLEASPARGAIILPLPIPPHIAKYLKKHPPYDEPTGIAIRYKEQWDITI